MRFPEHILLKLFLTAIVMEQQSSQREDKAQPLIQVLLKYKEIFMSLFVTQFNLDFLEFFDTTDERHRHSFYVFWKEVFACVRMRYKMHVSLEEMLRTTSYEDVKFLLKTFKDYFYILGNQLKSEQGKNFYTKVESYIPKLKIDRIPGEHRNIWRVLSRRSPNFLKSGPGETFERRMTCALHCTFLES